MIWFLKITGEIGICDIIAEKSERMICSLCVSIVQEYYLRILHQGINPDR